MKNFINVLLLIFMCNVNYAQINVKELEKINIPMKGIKVITIHRKYFEPVSYNYNTLSFDKLFFDKKYDLDTFQIHKRILFDSLGRIVSIRSDFNDKNSKYNTEENYTYLYPYGYQAFYQTSQVLYSVKDYPISGHVISENYIYYENGDLKNWITVYSNGQTIKKDYIYNVSIKCDYMVETYINNSLYYIDFYEVEYYNPFK
jgi:hypothetical protein